jgi:hypothetical protein
MWSSWTALVATVSQKSPGTTPRLALYAGAVTSSASHTVVIRPAGSERAKSISTQC